MERIRILILFANNKEEIKIMEEELLKKVYSALKIRFSNWNKNNWIWKDFFEDENVGFIYFKEQMEADKDFGYLGSARCYIKNDENVLLMVDDLADEVYDKLMEGEFFRLLIEE